MSSVPFLALQKRLPPLLQLEGIGTIEAAGEGAAFVPCVGDLKNLLCIHDEQIAGRDNTVR